MLDGVDIECGESASGGWNYSGLTPGVHVLDLYGIDQVGNSGQSATPGPVPTTRAEITFTEVYDTGRVVLIGHPDLYEEDWQDIFANAIRTSEPTLVRLNANKAPRILAFQPAGIDEESCNDMVEAIGFDVEGVDGDFDCQNQSDYPAGYTTLSSPAGLADAAPAARTSSSSPTTSMSRATRATTAAGTAAGAPVSPFDPRRALVPDPPRLRERGRRGHRPRRRDRVRRRLRA